MNKVYCQFCKYKGANRWCRYRPKKQKTVKEGSKFCGFYMRKVRIKKDPPYPPYYRDELNLKGDCKYYKRKWYIIK